MPRMTISRPSCSTGPARWSTSARSRRWACSSRPSRASASSSRSTRRAGRWAWRSAPYRRPDGAPRIAAAWRGAGRRRRGRHRSASTRCSCRSTSRWSRDYSELIPGAAEVVARAAGARHEDRLHHRLHARDHGARAAGRRRQGYAPDNLVCAGDLPARPADAVEHVQVLPRSRRSGRPRRDQGRRHRGRHRGRAQRRLLDRRRCADRQRLRPVACRYAALAPRVAPRRAAASPG